jgi:nicotinamide mononucleotide transporter
MGLLSFIIIKLTEISYYFFNAKLNLMLTTVLQWSLAPSFINWLANNYIEIIGAVFGASGVYLAIKVDIRNWWVALISEVMYIFIFTNAHLYADAGLQVTYIALTFYGVYQWKNKLANTPTLHNTSINNALVYTMCIVILTGIIYKLLNFVGSSMQFLDALTTSMSIVATYMMARKQLQHWLLWIITDSIYVYMYDVKHLYFTMVLYVLFVLMSVKGYRDWKKLIPANE